MQASVPRGFQAVDSNDNAKSFLDHGVPCVLLLSVAYFLLGPLKLDRAKGKDQAWSSPELGYELEFNKVPRSVAVAAQQGQCLGKKHEKQAQQGFLCAYAISWGIQIVLTVTKNPFGERVVAGSAGGGPSCYSIVSSG